jgi:hypothetical protein
LEHRSFFTCISALGKKLEGQLTEKLIVLNYFLFNRLLNYRKTLRLVAGAENFSTANLINLESSVTSN